MYIKKSFSRAIETILFLRDVSKLEFGTLVEFAYNNSYQVSIGMAPYEALYGRRCRTVGTRLEKGS